MILGYLGTPAGSSSQATPADLEGALAIIEDIGGETSSLLLKAKGALAHIHSSVFPKAQPLSSFSELAELFGPETSTLADYRHKHTVRGSQTTSLMLLGHGIEGDFDKAVSGRPCKPNGKALPLGDFSARSLQLAQRLAETMEKEAARQAKKPVSSFSVCFDSWHVKLKLFLQC